MTTKLGVDLWPSPDWALMGAAEINTESKKTNCHKWLIKSRQLSNLYQRLLSQKAADVTAKFLHQKGCNLFADHKFYCRVMSDFKTNAFTSKEAFVCFLFYSVTFLCCVKERMGPPAVCRTNANLTAIDVSGEKGHETEQTNWGKVHPLPVWAAILLAEDTYYR